MLIIIKPYNNNNNNNTLIMRIQTLLGYVAKLRGPELASFLDVTTCYDDAACLVQLPVPLPHQDRITRRKRRRQRQESRLLATTCYIDVTTFVVESVMRYHLSIYIYIYMYIYTHNIVV